MGLSGWVTASDLIRIEGTAETLPEDVRVIERYPGFVLAEAEADALAALRAAGITVQPLRFGYRLALPNADGARDPQAFAPWSRHDRVLLPADALALVQFHGPTRPEWLEGLRAAGVEVLQYLHPYTYLVWNPGALSLHAAEAEEIRWLGAWPEASRLALWDGELARTADPVTLRVLAYAGAGLDDPRLAAVGATLKGRAAVGGRIEELLVELPGTQAAALAGLSGVISVQDLPQDGGTRGELSNQQFVGNVGADQLPLPNYPAWLAQVGLDGSGIRMANVDSGVDDNHPALVNRMRPCTGTTCGGTGSSHGTHTAGIMAGDGGANVRDAAGFLRGLGVAPAAELVEQRYSPFFQQAGGMLLLMRESAANGAYLSGNSWGPAASPRGYDANTRQVDVGTRDTDPELPGDQPLLYVLSIMNGNGGTSTQGTPDEAKNVLTVGSTNSQASTGAALTSWRSLSSNSGHGPALDGRLIPHVVAPGCRVDSTTPSSAHGLQCGTSMASPHVAGAMGLFAQAYRQRAGQLPSPALAKAYAVASTVDLFGGTDANGNPLTRRPNARQGWGALRGGVMTDQLPGTIFVEQGAPFTATGDRWQRDYQPRNAAEPLKLVLHWTDAPGHGTCNSSTCTTPAWNNDLDLVVTAGDSTWRGNVFGADGFSTSGGNADERNNLESVILPAGALSGRFTVQVIARNLTSDALPNSPGAIEQDFALVCVNCRGAAELFEDGFER
jgi:subtilisin family serine protease